MVGSDDLGFPKTGRESFEEYVDFLEDGDLDIGTKRPKISKIDSDSIPNDFGKIPEKLEMNESYHDSRTDIEEKVAQERGASKVETYHSPEEALNKIMEEPSELERDLLERMNVDPESPAFGMGYNPGRSEMSTGLHVGGAGRFLSVQEYLCEEISSQNQVQEEEVYETFGNALEYIIEKSPEEDLEMKSATVKGEELRAATAITYAATMDLLNEDDR